MAHVGQKLRLVLARDLKLSALVLDFVEQAHVLDGDRSLVGKGRNQLDLTVSEWPHLPTRQSHHTDRHALAQHWYAQHGAKSTKLQRLFPCVIRVGCNVCNVNDLSFQQGPAK